jgi:hypothetical protein
MTMPLTAPSCTSCTFVPRGPGALQEILAELRGEGRMTAVPLILPSCTSYTIVPPGPGAQQNILAKLRERMDGLNDLDESGARAIVVDAVRGRLPGFAIEALVEVMTKKLGVKLTYARNWWKQTERQIRAEEAAREKMRKQEMEREQTRERLQTSCREIANDPNLFDRLTKTARRVGVVGEDASFREVYLGASSRFNRRKALSILRRGSAAAGKNYIIEKMLCLIPEEGLIRVSSASPLSLVYYGGEDENALQHQIIYVAEAQILVERSGESVLTTMLRSLISEGRIDRQVVVTAPNDVPTTVRVVRHGPVAVLITSARNNVEEELLTRLMISDADESPEQTERVIEAALTDEDNEIYGSEIDRWRDFQRWLALDAPYDVTIPYRPAILRAISAEQAVARNRGEKLTFQLRMRRDLHSFLTAIETSAILHKAQRNKNEQGRIIATLDDYQHAHEAFDSGLASLYKKVVPATTIAVVRAIEEMGATTSESVKVTVSLLQDKLGISSRGTTNDRLRDAEARSFIKLVERPGGYGKTTAREYTIAKHAEEIEREAQSSFGSRVFPSREAVEAEQNLVEQPPAPNYTEPAPENAGEASENTHHHREELG